MGKSACPGSGEEPVEMEHAGEENSDKWDGEKQSFPSRKEGILEHEDLRGRKLFALEISNAFEEVIGIESGSFRKRR
jgi:hypothetical protein